MRRVLPQPRPLLVRATCLSQSCPFSASAPRGPRSRPTSRRRLLLRTADEAAMQEVESEHLDAPRQGGTQSHVPRPSGPYKEVLLQSKCICYQTHHDGSLPHITTDLTKQQNRSLSAAERFFSQPSKFLYSAETFRHHAINDHVPEIVVLGSSNVGKSTFINALVGSVTAARVSQKPGHTTLMNAYGVGPPPKVPKELVPKGSAPPRHGLVVVDTPGYGFRSQATWGDAIMKYLQARRMLRGAVLLLSSEKKLQSGDEWVLRALAETNTRTIVALTKADKARSAWVDQCEPLAHVVQSKINDLHNESGCRWHDSPGPASPVYIIAAGMDSPGKLRNGGGMGGVRAAVLDMAGFTLQRESMAKKAETLTYAGPLVSFEDIQWKD